MDIEDAPKKVSAGTKPNRPLTEFDGASRPQLHKPKLILTKERTFTGIVAGIKS